MENPMQAYPRGRWSAPLVTFPVARSGPDSVQTPGAMERSLDRAASCEVAATGELFPAETFHAPKHDDRS